MKYHYLFLAMFSTIFLVWLFSPTEYQAINVDIKPENELVNIPQLAFAVVQKCNPVVKCEKVCTFLIPFINICLRWEERNCQTTLQCSWQYVWVDDKDSTTTQYNPSPYTDPYKQNGKNEDTFKSSSYVSVTTPNIQETYFWQKVCMGETIQNKYIKGQALLVERQFKQTCIGSSCTVTPTNNIRNQIDCTKETKVCITQGTTASCVRYPLEIKIQIILEALKLLTS